MKKIKYCSDKKCVETTRLDDGRILVSVGCDGKHCGGSLNMFLTEKQAVNVANAILKIIKPVKIHI